MKIAQMLGNIPGAVPEAYRSVFKDLQAEAPPMGPLFVKRRMRQELGECYQNYFQNFDECAFKAASLGQVHKGILKTGEHVVCKLQYPDMFRTVSSDLSQFRFLSKLYQKYAKGLNFDNFLSEVEERLYEELDYLKEAENIRIFQNIYASLNNKTETLLPRLPRVFNQLTTKKLLTMEYLEGHDLARLECSLDEKNVLGKQLFWYWYFPFYSHGIIHADPHMGNYTYSQDGQVNILDFGCIRQFPQQFVQGVIELYRGLLQGQTRRCHEAFEMWGFENLNDDILSTLMMWAKYIYGPLLEDRVRPIDEDYSSQKGRELAQILMVDLRKKGEVKPPREFVFLDRATVGIGGTLMHLRAQANWHQEFEKLLTYVDLNQIYQRQQELKCI